MRGQHPERPAVATDQWRRLDGTITGSSRNSAELPIRDVGLDIFDQDALARSERPPAGALVRNRYFSKVLQKIGTECLLCGNRQHTAFGI